MFTKLKTAGKFVGFWTMYGLMMVLAVVLYLLDKLCDGIDWLLNRMEKVLFKMDYRDAKEDTDDDCGV